MNFYYSNNNNNNININSENRNSDSISTHSSLNQNNSIDHPTSANDSKNEIISNNSNADSKNNFAIPSEIIPQTQTENCPIPTTFIKQKKGRPMNDTNIIVDDLTGKLYDPNSDALEYKKARK